MPTMDEFRREVCDQLQEAELRGQPWLELNSGEIHRKLGGYPSKQHQMPSCCNAMQGERRPGDEVLYAPPKGKGASLTIRYRLPRHPR